MQKIVFWSSFRLRYWRCTCLRLKNESDPSMSGRQSDHYSDVFRSLWRALPNDLHCSALFWASCHDQCISQSGLSPFFPCLTQVMCNSYVHLCKMLFGCKSEGRANGVICIEWKHCALCLLRQMLCLCYINKHTQRQDIFTFRYEMTLIVHCS